MPFDLPPSSFLPAFERQAFEQYTTFGQSRAHFFRQEKGRSQTGQVFVGRSAFRRIFAIAREAMGDSHGVTLNMTSDFLAPASVGELIEARGEVVRGGGKTIFVQGLATADGRPVLRFNAIIRKIRR